MSLRTLILVVAMVLTMPTLGGCSDASSNDEDDAPPTEPPDGSPPSDPSEEPPEEEPPEEEPPEEEPPEESPASLTVDDVQVREDNGSVTFIVRAEGVTSGEPVRVDFATRDGTATAGTDYLASAGSLEFLSDADEQDADEQTVSVDLIDDAEPEDEETFTLELSNPLNAEIVRPSAAATIADDDTSAVCGTPEAVSGEGAFLWKDCERGTWRFRALAQDDQTLYSGAVSASEAFVDVVPVGTGAGDRLENDPGTRLRFSITADTEASGFDFEVTDDAGTCFELESPDGEPVLVGQSLRALSTGFDLATLDPCEVPQPTETGPFNIVVLFTDDQRMDTLDMSIGGSDVMPNIRNRLLPRGVSFENAYVPIPLCCPARASTYSGGFLAQNTSVLDNLPPNGGMANFDDSVNIGTQLQRAGYRTMFIGKWLNDYPAHTPYVPPGWDTFAGLADYASNGRWSNFAYLLGSTGNSSGTGREVNSDGQYHVYFERDRIIDFLAQTPDDEPYFVFWSTTPPHHPAIPAEEDEDLFSDFTYRGRGYGEEDLSDKPRWVTSPGRPIDDDEDVRNQLRTLRSVDRAFGALMDTIAARGEMDETVFIITSDNGYMWGEHGLWNKQKPYEESVKVPLLVVMPGIEPRTDRHLVSAVLDMGPTLYDIAGTGGESEGRSLLPLLRNPATSWRNELFIEHYGIKPIVPDIWGAIRHGKWKYVKYWYGEEELYNLERDPFELQNLIPVEPPDSPPVREPRECGDGVPSDECADFLEARVDDMLGLSIHPILPWFDIDGELGEPYRLAIGSWGGEPPLEWQVESGRLPPGLRLDRSTGVISGTPSERGRWTFRVRVTGSSLAIQADRPQTYVSQSITVEIR